MKMFSAGLPFIHRPLLWRDFLYDQQAGAPSFLAGHILMGILSIAICPDLPPSPPPCVGIHIENMQLSNLLLVKNVP